MTELEDQTVPEGFVRHEITAADTLIGLSISYSIPVRIRGVLLTSQLSEIRKSNSLFWEEASRPLCHVTVKKHLIIPRTSTVKTVAPEVLEALRKRDLISRFMRDCGDNLVMEEEAKTFLERSEWDLYKALDLRHDEGGWYHKKLLRIFRCFSCSCFDVRYY
jgi:hypothetical protein